MRSHLVRPVLVVPLFTVSTRLAAHAQRVVVAPLQP
jgi:hypothetical protein